MCGHQKTHCHCPSVPEFPHLSTHTLWSPNTEQTFLRSDRFLPPPSFPRLPLACIKVPSWCSRGRSGAITLPYQTPALDHACAFFWAPPVPLTCFKALRPLMARCRLATDQDVNGGRLLPPPVSAAPVSVPSAASVYLTAPSGGLTPPPSLSPCTQAMPFQLTHTDYNTSLSNARACPPGAASSGPPPSALRPRTARWSYTRRPG